MSQSSTFTYGPTEFYSVFFNVKKIYWGDLLNYKGAK